MPDWSIHYADGSVVWGTLREQWEAAPDDGVQVVAVMAPYPDGRRPWSGVEDRQLWTGDDEYSLYGWRTKRGSLIDDETYQAIWREAAYGHR